MSFLRIVVETFLSMTRASWLNPTPSSSMMFFRLLEIFTARDETFAFWLSTSMAPPRLAGMLPRLRRLDAYDWWIVARAIGDYQNGVVVR